MTIYIHKKTSAWPSTAISPVIAQNRKSLKCSWRGPLCRHSDAQLGVTEEPASGVPPAWMPGTANNTQVLFIPVTRTFCCLPQDKMRSESVTHSGSAGASDDSQRGIYECPGQEASTLSGHPHSRQDHSFELLDPSSEALSSCFPYTQSAAKFCLKLAPFLFPRCHCDLGPPPPLISLQRPESTPRLFLISLPVTPGRQATDSTHLHQALQKARL